MKYRTRKELSIECIVLARQKKHKARQTSIPRNIDNIMIQSNGTCTHTHIHAERSKECFKAAISQSETTEEKNVHLWCVRFS